MRLKDIALWPILLFVPIVYAHAQETAHVEADQKLRARASLYEPLIASAARRYNVDPRLLWTIAYLESRFRQDAISYKDGKPCAYGMMQFTAPTAARYGLKNPHDVRAAIDAAARYVRDLQMRFGARGDLILAAYNAGEGTVEAFRTGKKLVLPNMKIINPAGIQTGGIPPYQETRKYVELAKIVYQSISRAGLFRAQEGVALERSANEVAESKSALADTLREDSVYSSQSVGKPPTQPTVKSQKSKGTTSTSNSIYVN
jgi:soluble lytic murein transglycosylase-like protein